MTTHKRHAYMLTKTALALMLCLGWAPGPALAFNGQTVTEDPVVLSIAEIADVTQLNEPRDVVVALENSGRASLQIALRLDDLVDEWYVVGEPQRTVTVAPGAQASTVFQIAAGPGTLSALYPVHVYASFQTRGQPQTAHAVRIFQSNFERTVTASQEPPELPINVVPYNGALPLGSLPTYRVAWQYYDQPLVYMPVGWAGSVAESSATFSIATVTRETTQQALVMHPPWRPGGGPVFVEYRLKLPRSTPITLNFANAIRDHSASEPPSDGVTFRVWADQDVLFERHTDAKRWARGQADLSRYAGRQILLRLESHPGPKHDTTCDSSYWGAPVITAGTQPEPLSETAREERRQSARTLVMTGHGRGVALALDGGYRAAILPGERGLCDGIIAVGNESLCTVFDGLRIAVEGQSLGPGPSALNVSQTTETIEDGGLTVTHRLQFGNENFDLTVRLWPEQSGLRIKLDCPKRITDFALGAADQKAPRVFYGHGYCIVEPETFRAGFGGHNLSTSHVGFEFDKGLSLLVATDYPPDYLEVDPEARIYALHTHLDATMTLVPSDAGAFDGALKYRPLYDKEAAPAFERKAGRFVFDIWGGRYAQIAETLQRMIDYGLNDSLLTVHVWQRWGYDYRLPDIYPPQPGLGTVADVQRIAALCAEYDIPWGLHDNYIDIYPDATDYSYDHVCFTEAGQPIKAWLNEGRDAQSYRWRPDHIMPFVQRNLGLIKPNLKPTHYFIDVFSSIDCFDYYDRQATFHSMLETRRCWGEAFAWIRDTLGGQAPMTSEAGHDQLVGYLDGADCQHLQLAPEPRSFCNTVKCQDWERVPWYDAVLHDKFSLHGVGYSGRYQGGRSRQEHGIESDDYLSAEILTGHALMIDNPGFGRGAVRKYWLAQDLVRSIAIDEIANVQCVDGDIHRQLVTWQSGARVAVNRSSVDWSVAGKVLPPYGYHAVNGAIESTIEKLDGIVVEQSRAPGRWYFSARGFGPQGQLAIRPEATAVAYLGDRRFELVTTWHAYEPAAKDLQIFIHFTSNESQRSDGIAFQGGGSAAQGTSQWRGDIEIGAGRTIAIPADYGPGTYEIHAGLWDPATGARYGLLGDDDGSMRYRLGTLVVEGSGATITDIRLIPAPPADEPSPQWNIERVAVDFGPALTTGAFRCERQGRTLLVTPLPDLAPFTIGLRPKDLGIADPSRVRALTAIDAAGNATRTVPYRTAGHVVEFETNSTDFAYQLLF